MQREKWDEYVSMVRKYGMDIPTLEDGLDKRAKHVASIGDWVIKGVKGEFYPCKPDIFELTYEPVNAAPTPPDQSARIAELEEALREINGLRSSTLNYGVARAIACKALGIPHTDSKDKG